MDKQADAALLRAIGMLEAILRRQVDIHREMLVLADEKQESVIKGDLEKLEKVVAEEKKLVARIEDEEKKRFAVMPLVKSGLGAGDEAEKLADVIALMPESEQGRLMQLRNELKELLEACQLKTRHNSELLRASLEHIEAFLRTVAEAVAKDSPYGKDGKRSGGGPTMIDWSV